MSSQVTFVDKTRVDQAMLRLVMAEKTMKDAERIADHAGRLVVDHYVHMRHGVDNIGSCQTCKVLKLAYDLCQDEQTEATSAWMECVIVYRQVSGYCEACQTDGHAACSQNGCLCYCQMKESK